MSGTIEPGGFERVISMRKAAADNATTIAHNAGLAALKAGLPSNQIVCTALDPHSDGFSNEGGSIVKYADAVKVRWRARHLANGAVTHTGVVKGSTRVVNALTRVYLVSREECS